MHWDRPAALARVGDDLELLQEIARLFLDDTPNMMSHIEQAIAARDADALGRSAHTLKGCVSNFGAAEVYEAALNLEKLGRNGDLDNARDGLDRLRRSLENLRPELEQLAAE